MKITVALTGEVSIETNGSDPKAIAELIRELQHPRKKKAAPATPATPAPVVEEPIKLSSAAMETWEWLVANDTSMAGHTAGELATALNIDERAAQQRLATLVKKGMAHRVSRGSFRPGEG